MNSGDVAAAVISFHFILVWKMKILANKFPTWDRCCMRWRAGNVQQEPADGRSVSHAVAEVELQGL